MQARLRMNLLCMGEEASFELFYGSPAGLDRTFRLQSPEQPPCFGREAAQLPRLMRRSDREKRRPETPVQERHLPAQKLCEQHIGMLSEIRQDRENEAGLRVTPPGVAKGLARQKRHDVREALVLRQEEATIRKGVKDLLRRLQDQARGDRIDVNRSLTARSPRVPRE
jgi:hypothetical protein